MEEILSNISLHAPLFQLDWSTARVLLVAAVAGVLLGLYCRLALGAFLVWGLVVGFLGVLFIWLVVSVLPLKWAILVVGAITLLVAAGFYVDEQTPVTGAELVDAAVMRDSHLEELFARDEDAAKSIAATLNLGLDESEPKWPENSMLAGIPKRVTRHIRFMLTFGFTTLAILALVFLFAIPTPQAVATNSVTDDTLTQYESTCGSLSGIEEERCLLNLTRKLEARFTALVGSAETSVLGSYAELNSIRANVPIEQWRGSMVKSEHQWREYRDSTCDTIKYLTYLGSGTGRFVARCRLRMTFEHVVLLESYGSGFPSYE